jgi:ABC-2 type transport system permease protein
MTSQALYQLRLFLRSPRALLGAAATPLVLMVLLASISDHSTEAGYHDGLAASMVTLGLGSLCYTTLAASLVASRDAGVLKRLLATPLPIRVHLAGRILATVVLTLVQSIALFAFAALVYGAKIPTGWPVFAGLGLGSLALCAAGLAVAQAIPRGDAAATLLSTTMLPVVLISGVFFPIGELPGWVGRIAEASPVTHVGALLAGSTALTHIWWLLGWTVGCLLLARWRFRVEPAQPRNRRRPAVLARSEA